MTSKKFKKAFNKVLKEFLAMTPEEYEADIKKHNTGEITQLLMDANVVFNDGWNLNNNKNKKYEY